MPVTYDVVVPQYEYEDDAGNTKTKWLTCGRIIETDKGLTLKIDLLPTSVCEAGTGNIVPFTGWLKLFETRPHSVNANAPETADGKPF